MKDEVIRLWVEGWSSGAIASELCLNRNKVMGHVWRAQKRGDIPKRKEPPKKVAAPKPKKAESALLETKPQKPVLKLVEEIVKPVVPPPPPPKASRPKTIMELGPFDCRYILPNKKYCGNPSQNYRQPWCDDHRKLVYVKGTALAFKKKTVFRFS